MRSLATESKSIEEFIINRFNDLTYASQPTAQGFGPCYTAVSVGGSNKLRAVSQKPASVSSASSETLVGHIGTPSRFANSRQTSVSAMAGSQEGVGQQDFACAGRSNAKAGNHPQWVGGYHQLEALEPAQTTNNNPCPLARPANPCLDA